MGHWSVIANSPRPSCLDSNLNHHLSVEEAGMVGVADGTPEAARRLERGRTSDPGTGVMRHVDAGYPEAMETALEHGIDLPSAPPHR